MIDTSPFDADEQRAQVLAGGGPAGHGIRPFMPQQHRSFFAGLPYLAVTVPDADGWPAARLLTGSPGFVHAPEPTILRIEAPDAEPLFRPGQPIGVLGIDLATRRRNRANGVLAGRDAAGLTVAVRQSFGNCPQYIQRRTVRPAERRPEPMEHLSSLDAQAVALLGRADTAFVASRSRLDGSADISHRGGRPGFIAVRRDTLSIPDFHGNRYFNTLGNLLGDKRAAVLVLDFDSGDLLHLQGRAEIDWTSPQDRFPGAERVWHLHLTQAWRRRGAVPLAWTFVDQAPTTAASGLWQAAA